MHDSRSPREHEISQTAASFSSSSAASGPEASGGERYLGLPRGKEAAVSLAPQSTHGADHTLQHYFSGLLSLRTLSFASMCVYVCVSARERVRDADAGMMIGMLVIGLVSRAKAADFYDEKTAEKLKVMSLARLEARAQKAKAASEAAAELLKPGGQSLVEYPQRPLPPVAPPQAQPQAVMGQQPYAYAPQYAAAPQAYAQRAGIAAMMPAPAAPLPPPPPAFSNAFNSFLQQVLESSRGYTSQSCALVHARWSYLC